MISMERDHVRRAKPGDREVVMNILAAAFHNDPDMAFIFPDPAVRKLRLPQVFSVIFDGDDAAGARFVTDNGEAATLWRRPGQGRLSLWDKARRGLPWLRAAGFALRRASIVNAASEANRPTAPHWYLHIAGCSPHRQGRGYGTAAIKAGLALADGDGVPAYLETSTKASIAFYGRFGFHVTHDWHVPGGPKSWSMLRLASSQVPLVKPS